MISKDEHFHRMTETPVPSLIISLALPTIVSMLVSSIYNMADTFFVAQIGTSAAAAVGITFSVMAIIQAIGFTIGMGAGNLSSRRLGARMYEEADRYASSGIFLGLLLSSILLVLGSLFLDRLMMALGATETVLPYARAYAKYIIIASPVMCLSFILNNYLRAEGRAFYGMIGITTGGILNIILDPIFIFSLDLGTAGAAIATAISQCISFIILLSFFIRKKSDLNLRIRSISFDLKTYRDIVVTGLPTLSRQGFASLSTICLNVVASSYGDAAIAAMSIAGRIAYFLFSFMLGFGQGFQPVAAFNYGAGLYKRVKDATKFTALVGTLLLFSISVICFLFAPDIIKLFRADDEVVVTLGSVALRLQCVALFLSGVTTTSNMALQSTGQSVAATVLALSRQGIFFIPLVIILPHLFGIFGLLSAQAIADVLTFILSIFFFRSFLRKLDRMSNGRDC